MGGRKCINYVIINMHRFFDNTYSLVFKGKIYTLATSMRPFFFLIN